MSGQIQMRLGCLPHDEAEAAALPSLGHHLFAARPPKQSLDRRSIDFRPRMGGNDTKPVCTVVALVNGMSAVAAVNGWQLQVDEEQIDPFYARVVGCTIDQIAATEGADPLAVLAAQLGGFDIGNDDGVGLYGTLPQTRTALANAMDALSFAYVGVELFDADMDAFAARKPWTGLPRGNSVGRHLVDPFDYLGLRDSDTGRAATWGVLHPFTWEWMMSHIRFAAGLAYRFLGTAGALDQQGDRLAAELAGMVG